MTINIDPNIIPQVCGNGHTSSLSRPEGWKYNRPDWCSSLCKNFDDETCDPDVCRICCDFAKNSKTSYECKFDISPGFMYNTINYLISEEKKMSILIMGAVNNEIFCVSDSRSVKSGKILSDNWKKIMYYKPYNMLFGITGANAINEENILDIIFRKLETKEFRCIDNSKDNLASFIAEYIRQQKNEDTTTSFYCGFYQDSKFLLPYPVIKAYDISNTEIKETKYGNGNIVYNGEKYAVEFLKQSNIFQNHSSASEIVSYLENEIKDIVNIGNKYLQQSTIGGPVQKNIINKH